MICWCIGSRPTNSTDVSMSPILFHSLEFVGLLPTDSHFASKMLVPIYLSIHIWKPCFLSNRMSIFFSSFPNKPWVNLKNKRTVTMINNFDHNNKLSYSLENFWQTAGPWAPMGWADFLRKNHGGPGQSLITHGPTFIGPAQPIRTPGTDIANRASNFSQYWHGHLF